jgi:membrane protein implicated in regulation of membrane protease activity
MRDLWRNNGLSLTLLGLFLFSWVGQAVAGRSHYNDEQAQHGQPAATLAAYLSTSDFWEATFENWESEFLQMAVFVLLTAVLYQRGSSESKRVGVVETVDVDPREVTAPAAPWPVKRGGVALRLYEHSLGLALTSLFLVSIAGHALAGVARHNQEQLAHGAPTASLAHFVSGGEFWFQSFQNWQSEFLSILAMVVLTIFLRQRSSPESKPVYAAHSDTGRD